MTTNTTFIGHLGRLGFTLDDARTAGPASAQSTAAAITSRCTRFTGSVANGSAVLRNVLTNDAPDLCFVINDSPNTIVVYCSAGDHMNGTLNSSLSIAAASFALFSRVQATLDWRSAAIS